MKHKNQISQAMGNRAGDVVRFTTEWIVQCQSEDQQWYDFSIKPSLGKARLKLKEVRQYRPANYRLIIRQTRDELLP